MSKLQIAVLEYLSLILIFASGVYFYCFFRLQSFNQFLVVVITSFAYVIWGTIHHLIRVRLYWHVIYEYILIAVLVVLLFAFSLNIL